MRSAFSNQQVAYALGQLNTQRMLRSRTGAIYTPIELSQKKGKSFVEDWPVYI
jgi:hypothetical protein